MKVIAFYLPQFYRTKENDMWWGNGYTEWTNVKKAHPLFDGHNQPRIPYNHHYYCLTDIATLEWQIKLAKQYRIYGFCFYHYWFSGRKLLQKPLEIFLANKQLQLPFCVSWANETWTKSWNINSSDDILITQEYGDLKEWKEHFDYFLSFFGDDRYIKIGEKPLLIIYRPEMLENRREMLLYWNQLARENGFSGMAYASQQHFFNIAEEEDGELFDYQIEYQPAFVREKLEKMVKINQGIHCIEYDDAWKAVLEFEPLNMKSLPGAFVDWDNTPRKGKFGAVFNGASPIKFREYFARQVERAEKVYNKDMIFLFAWNEWSEGGYLEPDCENRYGYLEAVRDVMNTYTR